MRLATTTALAALALLSAPPACAADDLLEVLARKGVISMQEYEQLKAQRKAQATVSTDDGFRLSSGDGAHSLQVGTLQQLDFAAYGDDTADLADGSEFRRSRLSVAGTFFSDWQYRVEYEFAGTTGLTDAYVANVALKPLTFTAGQFKQPFGMETIAADKNTSFMERGLPNAFITTRAPGLMVSSSGANWSGGAGVFGEPVGSVQAGDESWALSARATWAPLLAADRVVHLGLGVNSRSPTDDNSTNAAGPRFPTVRFRAKPESNVLAQRLVDTGEIADVERYTLAGLELAGALRATSLQAEYHRVDVDRDGGEALDFSGWYAQLAHTLTGEARPYRADRGVFEGIRPRHNLGRDGWGAFELAARISGIDLSDGDVVGGRERDATLGFNWYWTPYARFSLNYVKVLEVEGGAFDGEEPSVVQARVQLAI